MYRGGNTKSRIFGMDYEELEQQHEQMKKQHALNKANSENKSEPQDEKVTNVGQGATVDAEIQPDTKADDKMGSDGNPRMKAMEVRQRSFMDEDLSNNNRIRDQQMEQKKWFVAKSI